MQKPNEILVPIAGAVLGVNAATAYRMANDGRFGPLVVSPGMERYRLVRVAEFERRFGVIDDERLSAAVERHNLKKARIRRATHLATQSLSEPGAALRSRPHDRLCTSN